MKKLGKNCKTALIVGILTTLLIPVRLTANENEKPFSYVRKFRALDVSRVESDPRPVLPAPSRAEDGERIFEVFCFDREDVDKMNSIIDSEKVCRVNLVECRREKVIEIKTGWQTWEVVLLITGVGVAALALGFGLGQIDF